MTETLDSYADLLKDCLLQISSPGKRIEIIEALLAGKRVWEAFGGFLETPNMKTPGSLLSSFEGFVWYKGQFLGDRHQKVLRDLLADAVAAERVKPPKLPKLTLHFLHYSNGRRLTVKLDPDLTPTEIINELVGRKFLITEFVYELAIRRGQILDRHKSLRESGVQDGSEIRITEFEEND